MIQNGNQLYDSIEKEYAYLLKNIILRIDLETKLGLDFSVENRVIWI